VAATAEVTRLEGLEAADVGELMAQVTGGPVPEEIAAGMQARTGSNPLFVAELTRLLQARRSGAGRWHGAATVDSVREVIDRRLARLSQPCIRMLTVAALDGDELRPWLLARVLGDDADLPALIEEAAAARVVGAGEDSSRPRFAHDLFCEVLAAELPVPARRVLHRDLGAAWRRPAPTGPWSTPPSWPRTSRRQQPPVTPRPANPRSASAGRLPPTPPGGWRSRTLSLTSSAP
jgi:predicted ATPase